MEGIFSSFISVWWSFTKYAKHCGHPKKNLVPLIVSCWVGPVPLGIVKVHFKLSQLSQSVTFLTMLVFSHIKFRQSPCSITFQVLPCLIQINEELYTFFATNKQNERVAFCLSLSLGPFPSKQRCSGFLWSSVSPPFLKKKSLKVLPAMVVTADRSKMRSAEKYWSAGTWGEWEAAPVELKTIMSHHISSSTDNEML